MTQRQRSREDPRHERADDHDDRDARDDEASGEIGIGLRILHPARNAHCACGSGGLRDGPQPREDGPERRGHRRQIAQHGDDARHGDGARADVADVARPQLARAHLRDELRGFRIERPGQPGAEEGDERDQNEGRHERSRDQHRGLPEPENVADGEQRRRKLDGELCAGKHR